MVGSRESGRERTATWRRLPWWVGILATTLLGCASATYQVRSARAVRALVQAERSGAGEQATYELTLAQAYLSKAREEASQGAYQDAIRFAGLSQEYANKAVAAARAQHGTEK